MRPTVSAVRDDDDDDDDGEHEPADDDDDALERAGERALHGGDAAQSVLLMVRSALERSGCTEAMLPNRSC